MNHVKSRTILYITRALSGNTYLEILYETKLTSMEKARKPALEMAKEKDQAQEAS